MTRRKFHEVSVTPYTLPVYERDVTIVCAVADLVVNLPPAGAGTKGNKVTMTVKTISGGTGASFSPVSSDKIQGTGITAADNKDLINSGATDAVGDTLTLVCDGADGWWITSKIGTWAREA